MSVVIETTLGDITVDLYLKQRPRACLNFLKLCKIKYYNYNLFHTVSRGFIAQTGDPTGKRTGGESIFGVLEGPLKRYFESETNPRIKHTTTGLISFVGNEDKMIGSQFFLTLAPDLTYLDDKHCVFGEVVEGFDVVEIINEAICDGDDRPYQDIRITHTVILDDPFPDPERLIIPSRSPSPTAERLQGGRIAPDEEIDETVGKNIHEINEIIAEREAKARATILEMVGDIPDADMAPPENVLFVCKLNPVTTDDDLEIIFSRFGKIKCCEVIRDKKSGDSLQYAFVEFTDRKACEDAYFKMDNVLIDDRRIHVDFSQSVSKVRWLGKGRGVFYGKKGEKDKDLHKNLGKGEYKRRKNGEEGRKDRRDYDQYHRGDYRRDQRDSKDYRSKTDEGDRKDTRKRRDEEDNRRKRNEEDSRRRRNLEDRYDSRSRKNEEVRNENKSRRGERDKNDAKNRRDEEDWDEDRRYKDQKDRNATRRQRDEEDRYDSRKRRDQEDRDVSRRETGHKSSNDYYKDSKNRRRSRSRESKKDRHRKTHSSDDESSEDDRRKSKNSHKKYSNKKR